MLEWYREWRARRRSIRNMLYDLCRLNEQQLTIAEAQQATLGAQQETLTAYVKVVQQLSRRIIGFHTLNAEGQARITDMLEELQNKLTEIEANAQAMRDAVVESITAETGQLRQMIADLRFAIENGASKEQLEALVTRAQNINNTLTQTKDQLVAGVAKISDDAQQALPIGEEPVDGEDVGEESDDDDDDGEGVDIDDDEDTDEL